MKGILLLLVIALTAACSVNDATTPANHIRMDCNNDNLVERGKLIEFVTGDFNGDEQNEYAALFASMDALKTIARTGRRCTAASDLEMMIYPRYIPRGRHPTSPTKVISTEMVPTRLDSSCVKDPHTGVNIEYTPLTQTRGESWCRCRTTKTGTPPHIRS